MEQFRAETGKLANPALSHLQLVINKHLQSRLTVLVVAVKTISVILMYILQVVVVAKLPGLKQGLIANVMTLQVLLLVLLYVLFKGI